MSNDNGLLARSPTECLAVSPTSHREKKVSDNWILAYCFQSGFWIGLLFLREQNVSQMCRGFVSRISLAPALIRNTPRMNCFSRGNETTTATFGPRLKLEGLLRSQLLTRLIILGLVYVLIMANKSNTMRTVRFIATQNFPQWLINLLTMIKYHCA